MANPRVIKLLGHPIQEEDHVAKASEAIVPGMLISLDTNEEWVKHPTADGKAAPIFALEREELGLTIDDEYEDGDVVKAGHFHQGNRVNAWLASGQNVAAGATLHSAGTGMLKAGSTAGVIVGRAVRDADATSGAVRVALEVM